MPPWPTNAQECVALLRRLYDQDSKALEEAKQHLTQVLSGEMGASQGGRTANR